MKRIILAVALLAPLTCFAAEGTPPAGSDDFGNTIKTLVVAAKFSGACGVMRQMSAFQATTGMPGGDAFVARFISTEAARLGTTTQGLLSECERAISTYNETIKMLGGT